MESMGKIDIILLNFFQKVQDFTQKVFGINCFFWSRLFELLSFCCFCEISIISTSFLNSLALLFQFNDLILVFKKSHELNKMADRGGGL